MKIPENYELLTWEEMRDRIVRRRQPLMPSEECIIEEINETLKRIDYIPDPQKRGIWLMTGLFSK